MRIVVLGYVVRYPLGGLAWHYIQYAMGLAAMGHDVAFIEDSGDETWCCYDPVRHVSDTDATYGLGFAKDLFERIGLGDRWAYFDKHSGGWRGSMAPSAQAFCESADIIINISGANAIRPWMERAPAKVYLDTDPVFTQVRNLNDPERMAFAQRHNVFLTFAENYGRTATIPDDGFPWRRSRQPIVIDAWDLGPPEAAGPYSTVMQWSSYKPVEYRGRKFGMKSETFTTFESLPSRVDVDLTLALGSSDAPRDRIADHGWRIADPLAVTRDAWSYQGFIAASRAEFSIAKHGYVVTKSGWFSERSANYLAAGRPVIAQDTAFDTWLPVGAGLFSVTDVEEAVEAIAEVEADYERHVRSAREIAARHFDSAVVLQDLLDAVGEQT